MKETPYKSVVINKDSIYLSEETAPRHSELTILNTKKYTEHGCPKTETLTPIISNYEIRQNLVDKNCDGHMNLTIYFGQHSVSDIDLEEKIDILCDIQKLLDTKYAKFSKGYD